MSKVQVIKIDGKPAFYVVPAELWERMLEAAEEAEDAADLKRFDRDDTGVRVPVAVVMAKLDDGAHPVKAWREYRGMSLQALADAAGLNKHRVNQIEEGIRVGTAATGSCQASCRMGSSNQAAC